MNKRRKLESSHIPLNQVLGEIGEPFTIVTTEEKVTTDIHGIIDYAVYGLSVVPAGFIAYKNHIVREGFNDFDLSAHDLLEDGKTMGDVTKSWVFIITDNDDFHNVPPMDFRLFNYLPRD